jgi:hypothetical protein
METDIREWKGRIRPRSSTPKQRAKAGDLISLASLHFT